MAVLFAISLSLPVPVLGAQAGTLRMIAVDSEAEAQDLRTRVASGESFYGLAVAHSIDPTASNGGLIGEVSAGDLTEGFARALPREGDAVGPVTAADGVFVLLRWATPAEIEWEAVRSEAFDVLRSGSSERAMDLFVRALALAETFGEGDPRLGESLNDLAEVRRSDGFREEAASYFRRAHQVWARTLGLDHPAGATSLTNLGRTLHELEDLEGSEAAYRRAVDAWTRVAGPSHSNVAAARRSLAVVLRDKGDFGEAETIFRDLLETAGDASPPRGALLADLAETLVRDDRPREAVSFQEAAIEEEWRTAAGLRGNASAARALVDLLLAAFVESSERDVAGTTFMAAVSEPAVGELFLVSSARLLASSGLGDDANAVLDLAVRRFPGSRAVRVERGGKYAEAGEVRTAISLLEAALELGGPGPSDGAILYRIAEHLIELGDFVRAREILERALDEEPDSASLWVASASLRLRQAMASEARQEFEKALELAPDDVEALIRLAELDLNDGGIDRSILRARRALGVDPGEARARYILARALIQQGRTEEGEIEFGAYREGEDAKRREEAMLLEQTRIETDAMVRIRDGDIQGGLDSLEMGAREHPGSARLHLVFALQLLRDDQFDRAVRRLEDMIDSGLADDSMIHRALDEAYTALGDDQQAAMHEALMLDRIRLELAAEQPVQP